MPTGLFPPTQPPRPGGRPRQGGPLRHSTGPFGSGSVGTTAAHNIPTISFDLRNPVGSVINSLNAYITFFFELVKAELPLFVIALILIAVMLIAAMQFLKD